MWLLQDRNRSLCKKTRFNHRRGQRTKIYGYLWTIVLALSYKVCSKCQSCDQRKRLCLQLIGKGLHNILILRQITVSRPIKCSAFWLIFVLLGDLHLNNSTLAEAFLIVMNISQIRLNHPWRNQVSEQNKTWGKWYVGFSNSNSGVCKLLFLALHIYGVRSVPRAPSPRSSKQGDVSLYSTIILDCQTKTATPCSRSCIAYKTCNARKEIQTPRIYTNVT